MNPSAARDRRVQTNNRARLDAKILIGERFYHKKIPNKTITFCLKPFMLQLRHCNQFPLCNTARDFLVSNRSTLEHF
jgi:hypothetical protein